MKIEKELFGLLPDGREVSLFRITNHSGAIIELTNWGATWISAMVPDRAGRFEDVLLGYSSLDGYLSDQAYLGCTVGRFANRIGNACFHLGGLDYYLDRNDGSNTNHGGFKGLNQKLWNYELLPAGITFSVSSNDGEGGFPGNIMVAVKYEFTEENRVSIEYTADTDCPTFLNLTNHAYFNLSGKEEILDHTLEIPSNFILETGKTYIPTGTLMPVEGTPFDFRSPQRIGDHIFDDNNLLNWSRGYNQCFVLNKKPDQIPVLAARLMASGRILEVYTTYPGIMVYTGNYLDATVTGKKGKALRPYAGVALEAQYFPDSPNHSHFPPCLLIPGEKYNHKIVFTFLQE